MAWERTPQRIALGTISKSVALGQVSRKVAKPKSPIPTKNSSTKGTKITKKGNKGEFNAIHPPRLQSDHARREISCIFRADWFDRRAATGRERLHVAETLPSRSLPVRLFSLILDRVQYICQPPFVIFVDSFFFGGGVRREVSKLGCRFQRACISWGLCAFA
jgi:hypothetical protein